MMSSSGEGDLFGGNLTPAQQDWAKQFGDPGQSREVTFSRRFHTYKMSWRERDVVSLKMKKRRAYDAEVELSDTGMSIRPPSGLGELRAAYSQMAAAMPGYGPAPIITIPWSRIDGLRFKRGVGSVTELGGGRYELELRGDFGLTELTVNLSHKQSEAIRTLIGRYGLGTP
jgi:hypothetical protein